MINYSTITIFVLSFQLVEVVVVVVVVVIVVEGRIIYR